jgi:hypothetical protein
MDRITPVVVTELDVEEAQPALRFMAVFYGAPLRVGYGATYFDALRDLLQEIGTVPRRAH